MLKTLVKDYLHDKQFLYGNRARDIIVFCHLRWNFVTQRPQHIIRRMAKERRILFFELPLLDSTLTSEKVKIFHSEKNITVIQPHLPKKSTRIYTEVVQKNVEKYGFDEPILWFYSPEFIPIIEKIKHRAIVYDCMDQLSAFKDGTEKLKKQERELLSMADIVFTGGKSLYEDKKKYSKNVHCLTSSVDKAHFIKALDAELAIPSDINNIPRPIVGYYGVIDERIDLRLLQRVALAMPKVSFVMIGPLAKIKKTKLPRAKNIYYLGQKDYKILPQYLKAIDIAMMPFARNKATEFISPTKTLEFMAAQKPIISTHIYDVIRDYQKEVALISSTKEFEKAIVSYLHESKKQRQQRIALQKAVIERTSWDKTTEFIDNKLKALTDHETTEKSLQVSKEPILSPNLAIE